MQRADVTLSHETIHNPAEPRHFMRLLPVHRRVVVRRGEGVLAESTGAVRLVEIGRDVYPPALYIPVADASTRLRPNDRRTHCPLKGDATYYDLTDEAGAVVAENLAWRYPSPVVGAEALANRIAFYVDDLSIEEHPQ